VFLESSPYPDVSESFRSAQPRSAAATQCYDKSSL
jgi:hypothetical protein